MSSPSPCNSAGLNDTNDRDACQPRNGSTAINIARPASRICWGSAVTVPFTVPGTISVAQGRERGGPGLVHRNKPVHTASREDRSDDALRRANGQADVPVAQNPGRDPQRANADVADIGELLEIQDCGTVAFSSAAVIVDSSACALAGSIRPLTRATSTPSCRSIATSIAVPSLKTARAYSTSGGLPTSPDEGDRTNRLDYLVFRCAIGRASTAPASAANASWHRIRADRHSGKAGIRPSPTPW